MTSPWIAVVFASAVVLDMAMSTPVPAAEDAAVTAIASLTDAQKLATLRSERAANDRLLKCVYWLNQARAEGDDPAMIIDQAQVVTGTPLAHASLVKQGLLRIWISQGSSAV